MSHEERGVYITLLCIQWSQGSLAADDFTRVAGGSFKGCLDRIKSKFLEGKDGRFRNERMEFERLKQSEYREKCAEAGKKGGGNPNFQKGKRNPYYKDKGTIISPLSGKDKGKINSPSPSPSPSPDPDLLKEGVPAAPAVSSEHVAFIDGWTQNFKAQFGFEYVFEGGRDGKAVRDLLRMQILRIDLLEIAKKAWKRAGKSPKSFNCEQASTIHGFKNYFNQIQVELKNGNTHQPVNKRLDGVARPETDWAAAAKRKVERDALATQHQPPPGPAGT